MFAADSQRRIEDPHLSVLGVEACLNVVNSGGRRSHSSVHVGLLDGRGVMGGSKLRVEAFQQFINKVIDECMLLFRKGHFEAFNRHVLSGRLIQITHVGLPDRYAPDSLNASDVLRLIV